jgi:hypothetical protein
VHHSISQMKHQLDATLCRFYFCRVTLYVSGVSAHHQEYLKTSTAVTGTCVIVVGQSSHLLIRAVPALITCIKLVFSFDLYYDARKHKIKTCIHFSSRSCVPNSPSISQIVRKLTTNILLDLSVPTVRSCGHEDGLTDVNMKRYALSLTLQTIHMCMCVTSCV